MKREKKPNIWGIIQDPNKKKWKGYHVVMVSDANNNEDDDEV